MLNLGKPLNYGATNILGKGFTAVTPMESAQFNEAQRQFNERMKMYNEQWDFLKGTYQQGTQGTGGLNDLINQYNKSYAEGKYANEARYQQQLGLVGQATDQRRADIMSQYAQQQANTQQQLARTGLSNTTIAPTLASGVEREKQATLNRLTDQMLQEKLGVIGQQQQIAPSYLPTTDVMKTMAGYMSNIYGTLGGMKF